MLRFPYGTCDAEALAAAADQGLYAIQWDLITGDPDPHRSAKAIAETILGKVHPGAIIVAHANGRGWHTADALAIAIPKLKEEGYGFVTVSELLAGGKARDRGHMLPQPAGRGPPPCTYASPEEPRCLHPFRPAALSFSARVLSRSILPAA